MSELWMVVGIAACTAGGWTLGELTFRYATRDHPNATVPLVEHQGDIFGLTTEGVYHLATRDTDE